MAATWKEVTGVKKVVDEIFCDNCSAKIDKVFPEHDQEGPQGIDMLAVMIHGGYGELIDGQGTALFCSDCGKKLFQQFPSIYKSYRDRFSGKSR